MKMPEQIDISPEELAELLKRAESRMKKEDYEVIKGMAETLTFLSYTVDNKNVSIKRMLGMLFGSKTEKTKDVTKDNSSDNQKDKNNEKKGGKPKGEGRNGASAYTGADKVPVAHESLKPKDPCPLCDKGKVYDINKPGVIVRVTGNAPLSATVYELQKLRCNLCGEIFTAKTPINVGKEKYDAASGAMVALLKYGSGLPFNRLEQLQGCLGVPLPASTQWDIVEDFANHIYPAFDRLKYYASQGDVIYNDDTVMKILDLIKEIKQEEDEKGRKGMFTSGILSTNCDYKIALFYTGRKHAGENLNEVLSQRSSDLDLPIQMCDALSRNVPQDFKTILSNCLAHARRKYVEVECNFPEECHYVLKILEKVYKNNKVAKQQNMTPAERLLYHQTNSDPLMEKLKTWLDSQFSDKKVEPNSGLGQAVFYMLNHWKEFTTFLREPNVPLDNNICERALKKAILHRKNSLFFKTEHGAYIGDLFMSLIHTCALCKTNPFKYLKALKENSKELFKDAGCWMPWNYQGTLKLNRSISTLK